uniref:Fas-binding factor 1 C-terminal domain-containing protein n=1 Tax=Eptatretus burgeri TaxID=7764 RepID=A0A8C4QPW1_EPTBU
MPFLDLYLTESNAVQDSNLSFTSIRHPRKISFDDDDVLGPLGLEDKKENGHEQPVWKSGSDYWDYTASTNRNTSAKSPAPAVPQDLLGRKPSMLDRSTSDFEVEGKVSPFGSYRPSFGSSAAQYQPPPLSRQASMLNKEVNVAGDSQLPSDNWDTEKPDQEVSTSHVTNEKWSIEKQQPSIRSDFVEEEDSEYKTVHEGGKKTSKKDGDWLSRLLARSQAQVVSQTHHGASRDAIEHSSHSEPHAVEETLKSGPDSNIANRHQKGSLSSSKSDFLGLKDANDDEDEDSFTGIIPNSSKVVGMITSSGLHKGQLKEPQPNQQPSSSQSTRPDEHAHDVGILQKMENVVSKESIHSGAPMSNLKQHSGGSVDGYVFGNSVRIQGASSFQNEQLAGQDQCTAPVQSGMKTGAMKECLTSTPHTSKNALQFAEPTFSSLAVDHSSEKQLHAARDVVIKLHQLEVENVQLKALLETQQTRHEQEFTSLEDMYKKAVSEMQKDYEEQMQRLRRLKDQEVDAVTSATAQTRSLSTVIEHMEAFSQRLAELASQLDSYRQHSRQDADFEMRQREQQIKGGLLGCWLQILFNVLMLRLVLQVKCCALQHSDGRKGR